MLKGNAVNDIKLILNYLLILKCIKKYFSVADFGLEFF